MDNILCLVTGYDAAGQKTRDVNGIIPHGPEFWSDVARLAAQVYTPEMVRVVVDLALPRR